MKPARCQQRLCPLTSLFKEKFTGCTKSGTMLKFFCLLLLSISFSFSKNSFIYRKKKKSRNNILKSHSLLRVKMNTADVALHKLAMIALFTIYYEQN